MLNGSQKVNLKLTLVVLSADNPFSLSRIQPDPIQVLQLQELTQKRKKQGNHEKQEGRKLKRSVSKIPEDKRVYLTTIAAKLLPFEMK